jgi:hypothetical protein
MMVMVWIQSSLLQTFPRKSLKMNRMVGQENSSCSPSVASPTSDENRDRSELIFGNKESNQDARLHRSHNEEEKAASGDDSSSSFSITAPRRNKDEEKQVWSLLRSNYPIADTQDEACM